MADYTEIKGNRVQYLDSDPTLTSAYEGQVWYNTATGTLRGLVQLEAWSSGSPMITTRRALGGGSSTDGQSAAIGFGGDAAPPGLNETNATEEYNGSGWSNGGNLSTARTALAGCGTQTSTLGFGGRTPSNIEEVTSEEYSGTAWTAGGNLNTGRRYLAGTGTQTAGLAIGGGTGGAPGASTALTASEEYDGSAWTSGNSLLTAGQSTQGSAGTQTAGLYFGSSPDTDGTESYDGTSWTNVANLNTGRNSGSGFGLQTAAVYAGGPSSTATENYDGTTWTTSPATLGTGRYAANSMGSSTAGIYFSGAPTPGGKSVLTEEYNSSVNTVTPAAWASGGSMGTGVSLSSGTGTQTATLSAGGFSTTYENVTQEYDGSSWANGGNYPGARYGMGISGTQTSAVAWTGRLNGSPGPGSPAETNEYNGSTWTSSNNFPTAGSGSTGFGTQTATIATIPSSDTTVSYDGTSWTTLGAPSNKNTSTLDGIGSLGTSTAGLLFGGRLSPGPTNTANSEEWDGSVWTAGGSLPTAIVFMNGFGTQTSSIGFGGDAPPGETARADAYSYDGSAWSTDASLGTAVSRMGAGVSSPSTAGISFGGIGPAGGGTGRTATEEYNGETSAATASTLTTS